MFDALVQLPNDAAPACLNGDSAQHHEDLRIVDSLQHPGRQEKRGCHAEADPR